MEVEMKTSQQINSVQFLFIIFQTQVGVGILSLPSSLYSSAGKDGWIAIILAGLGFQIVILIIYYLSKRFPTLTLYEYAPHIAGRLVGTVISIGYVLFAGLTAILVLQLFHISIKTWILPKTPSIVVLLLLSLSGAYLVSGRVKVLGRYNQFITILILPLIVMILISMRYSDIRYILPIGEHGLRPILKATPEGFFSMIGFEMALFVFPYLQNKGKAALISLTLSNVAVTSLYCFITFATFTFFSPSQLETIQDPTVYMLKGVTFIVDRIDLLFLSIWTISVLTSFGSYLYISSEGIRTLTKRKKATWSIVTTTLLILSLSLIPHSSFTVPILSKYHALASYFFVLGIPLLLLIISWIRKIEVTDRHQ
ncbi:GerAB/ArcD/ProY family transporter [Pseudalkalibacillus hwajinpoensis]|uniref:GerAB/ArcD/ProY family transporter n=1 Tax=Guptibacillus hwajinpoensis TaxID=208199 RepID=UPI001CFE9449|nr:endospore germination permease [Pseudalkalibacillus hwajinpoensis]